LLHAAVAMAFASCAQAAAADLVDIVNGIRRTGCDREAPVGTPVERDDALAAAARRVADKAALPRALEQSAYRATTSTLINIGGVVDDAGIREVLADGFCNAVNSDAYTEIGAFQRGKEFWLVLAAPLEPLELGDPRATAELVLELVNDARTTGQTCGRAHLPPVRPVALSTALGRAAAAQAADMAANEFVGHEGSDGSNVGERVTRSGYRWRNVGENVAAGQLDGRTVVRAWLESPGHCENIMGAQYTDMGVAFSPAPHSDLRIVWSQVFAAPQ
jgi:uncharacterized protein YkwD